MTIWCGCSGSDQDVMMNAGVLLDRYERDQRRHDPLHFSEVDLGDYTVTQRHDRSILYIRFHLYGVVPDRFVDKFTDRYKHHKERLREAVRKATQRCEVDQLNDPSLGWLKSELIRSINRELEAPLLRDVVFSKFSFERG
jgi:hypothetical protein